MSKRTDNWSLLEGATVYEPDGMPFFAYLHVSSCTPEHFVRINPRGIERAIETFRRNAEIECRGL